LIDSIRFIRFILISSFSDFVADAVDDAVAIADDFS